MRTRNVEANFWGSVGNAMRTSLAQFSRAHGLFSKSASVQAMHVSSLDTTVLGETRTGGSNLHRFPPHSFKTTLRTQVDSFSMQWLAPLLHTNSRDECQDALCSDGLGLVCLETLNPAQDLPCFAVRLNIWEVFFHMLPRNCSFPPKSHHKRHFSSYVPHAAAEKTWTHSCTRVRGAPVALHVSRYTCRSRFPQNPGVFQV